MDRYKEMFACLNGRNEKAFVPYVTLGDPTPETSLEIIEALIAGGADALELGIPFSDPLADGPVIQASAIRALNAGVTPNICFDIIRQVRERHSNLPIGLLMYANLVFSNGIDNFYAACEDSGVDSVLIGDVPVEESKPFRDSALRHGIHTVFFAPPNADEATLKSVSAFCGGYVYLLSRAGVTSTEKKALMPDPRILNTLKALNAPPPMLGFGISTPEQVRLSVQEDIGGVISGSAVVKIIESNLRDIDHMISELTAFVVSMKGATTCNTSVLFPEI